MGEPPGPGPGWLTLGAGVEPSGALTAGSPPVLGGDGAALPAESDGA
ncbi:hypothetical protein [Mycolicibacterium sphagni]|nr:hypothetical protein [Mycolicibacterium sphagni]MCV7178082.1 hypothetical protein [Mycolicibacterium sphagni]